jgi:hypothetical protein
VQFRDDAPAVGEDLDPIPFAGPAPQECSEDSNNEAGFQKDCHPQPGPIRKATELKRVALFHYVTKSWEDYQKKMVRGDGNRQGQGKTQDLFDAMQRYDSLSLDLQKYTCFRMLDC